MHGTTIVINAITERKGAKVGLLTSEGFRDVLDRRDVVDARDAILGFYVAWLKGMARRVEKVQVIALQVGEHDLPANVEVISLGKDRGAGTLSMFASFQRSLWRLCRRASLPRIHLCPRAR